MTKDMSCQQYNLPIKYNQEITQHQRQAVILTLGMVFWFEKQILFFKPNYNPQSSSLAIK